MRGALHCYRRLLAEDRRYSLPAYALGATLRRRFSEAGAVAWVQGAPAPTIRPGSGRIEVGDIGLYPGVKLVCADGGRITIGDGTYLNRDTLVYARESVTIGRDAMVSWGTIITDTEGFGEREGVGRVAPVTIGDRAWIGCRVVILAGADIGEGAVVAAGAVVSGRVEPGAIAVGPGAREIESVEALLERRPASHV